MAETKDVYEDIINLPHHVSERHPQMPMAERAAQFSPFAALTGFGAVIRETERQTDQMREMTENEREELDYKLGILCNFPGENPIAEKDMFAKYVAQFLKNMVQKLPVLPNAKKNCPASGKMRQT